MGALVALILTTVGIGGGATIAYLAYWWSMQLYAAGWIVAHVLVGAFGLGLALGIAAAALVAGIAYSERH